MKLTVLSGDCLEQLRALPARSAQCCVTSPPYWGLRSYLPKDHPLKPLEIGQEKTPQAYVETMVAVFHEVKRVLRDDATLWVVLGDSYSSGGRTTQVAPTPRLKARDSASGKHANLNGIYCRPGSPVNCKPKDLIGIPWLVAFALRADGWYLRSDTIWAKPNCMPESVRDRPTRSHEYIFLLSKKERYFYDADAIKEPPSPELLKQIEEGYSGQATKDFAEAGVQNASDTKSRIINGYRQKIDKQRGHSRRHDGFNDRWDGLTKAEQMICGANKRDVWTVSPAPFSDWTKTVVWNRAEVGARGGDIRRIVLPDCRDGGGLFDLLATVLCDEHADASPSRIADICNRLALEPRGGFVPIDLLRDVSFCGESLDSFLLNCFASATGRSIESHKKGLFVSTILACKPSAERSSRIGRILAQQGFSVPHRDMLLNNTLPDEMDARLLDQTLFCTGSSFSFGESYRKGSKMSSHFATFPPDLIKPCILAGSKPGDTVLDPFGGSGTTGQVALELGRAAVLIELNPDYIPLIKDRTNVTPGLALL